MLCPEVWKFPRNRAKPSHQYGSYDVKATKNLYKCIQNYPFNKMISIILPGCETVPASVEHLIETADYYVIRNLKLCDLVAKDFVESFIKRGSITGISTDSETIIDSENVFAINPEGHLILSINKDLYTILGLEGRPARLSHSHQERFDSVQQKGLGEAAMPKYKQPPPLEELALKASVKWLCDFGKQYMKTFQIITKQDTQKAAEALKVCIQTAHDVFEYNVPHYLFDRLGNEVFSSVSKLIDEIKNCLRGSSSISEYLSQMNVAVGLAEIVVSPFLRHLDFLQVPKMMRHMFYTKLNSMLGLEYLNLSSLSGGWKTSEMEPMIITGISCMRNLRALVLNYDCTDTILELLETACPRLHTLDICSSKSITNNSVKYLQNLKALRVLHLYRTSIMLEGYVRLLVKMPFLQDIGRFDDIGRCLEFVDMTYEGYDPWERPKLQLRTFSSRFVITKHLQLLSELCPEITTVLLFHNPLLNDLMALIGINKLSVLKLLSCDFFGDQVRDVLQVKGCNLTHLHFEHVDQLDMNALMYISQYCPDLKILTFYNCELIESTSLYTKRLEIPPFMNLEQLTIAATCFNQHMEFLMSHCLKIKKIHIGTMAPTSDALLDTILSKNPMQYLESLNIVFSNGLSIRMAYKLIEVCQNLTQLGELGSWSLINEFELECFKMFISTKNLDLDINAFARFSGEPHDSTV